MYGPRRAKRKGYQMSTITKTTPQAISRKLSSMGFDKYDRWTETGFSVLYDGRNAMVSYWSCAPGTAAIELAAAGYVITNLRTSKREYAERYVEMFTIEGKVSA